MSSARPPAAPGPWRPRFGLATLLLAMLVVCVGAASLSYGVRAFAVGSPRSAQLVFVLFSLASAPLLVVVVSIAYHIYRWLERAGRR